MINEVELKKQYNEELKRYKKCEDFMENPKISLEEKMKWIPQSQEIINKLGGMLNTMKQNSIKYKDSEVLHGFLI